MHPWSDFFPLLTQLPQQGRPVAEQTSHVVGGEVGLPVGLSVVPPLPPPPPCPTVGFIVGALLGEDDGGFEGFAVGGDVG